MRKRFTKQLLVVLTMVLAISTAAQTPLQVQRLEKAVSCQAISPHKLITRSANANTSSNYAESITDMKLHYEPRAGETTHEVDFMLEFNPETQRANGFELFNNDVGISSFDLGMFDLYQGSNVAALPAGTYDMIFTFTQLDTLESDFASLTVIREHVTVDQDMRIVISANEAKNHIHFELLTPTGEQCIQDKYYLDDNYTLNLLEKGNIDDCFYSNRIVCSDYGLAFQAEGNIGIKLVEGPFTSKGIMAASDFFVNDVSDRYSFYSYRTAFQGHEVFNTAFETVGAAESKSFTNNPDEYYEYEMSFKAAGHHGEELYPALWPIAYDGANIMRLQGSILDPITDGDTIKCYLGASIEDSPVNSFIPNVFLQICKLEMNDWGFEDYIPVVSSMPLTNVGNEVILTNNGSGSYIMMSGVPNYRVDFSEDLDGPIIYPLWPTHPSFTYNVGKIKGIIGDNCPLLVSDIYQVKANRQFAFHLNYLGRYGESSEGQSEAQVSIKLNDEELITANGAFELDQLLFGVVDATITNELVDVDGLTGSNKAKLHYTAGAEDETPPTMTMLHFKDANDDVTDRFATAEEGTVEFSAADYNFFYTPDGYYYFRHAPAVVEVSYATYGEDNWNELPVEELPEYYWPIMGWFYRGSLAGVTGQALKGWFDLKVKLTDAAGNWQEQIISPAFRIDDLAYTSVANIGDGNAHEVARYSIDGKRVDASHHGVTIIKMSDGTAKKMIVQ